MLLKIIAELAKVGFGNLLFDVRTNQLGMRIDDIALLIEFNEYADSLQRDHDLMLKRNEALWKDILNNP